MNSVPSLMKCFYCGGERLGKDSIDDTRLMGYSACTMCLNKCLHGTSQPFMDKVYKSFNEDNTNN